VASATHTLQPGEIWDAFSTWLPLASGHRCVQATLDVDFLSGLQVFDLSGTSSVGPLQQNLDIGPGPCNKLDAGALVMNPGQVSNIPLVNIVRIAQHFANALNQAHLIRQCLDQQLVFRNGLREDSSSIGTPIYSQVVTPPVYTPPPMLPGDGVTPAQAAAATAVGDIAAELAGLNAALVETNNRRSAAWYAGDGGSVTIQILAFREFQVTYAAKLSELATAFDNILALTEGAGVDDFTFMPQHYSEYLDVLQTSGYDSETISFHQQLGLNSTQIDQMLDSEITESIHWNYLPASFYDTLHTLEAEALTLSAELTSQYGGSQVRSVSSSSNIIPESFFVDTMTIDFEVGNPMISQETLNLVILPVDIPVGWTYSLSNPAPLLDPGETMTVTLTLQPDAPMLENTHVRLAVEGFINGEYIGGILYNQVIPSLSGSSIYLPIMAKP
jgi:hypothetical protein